MSVETCCAGARGTGAMNTAAPKSALATARAKHFRVALVEHLIQKDIAGLDIQTYCSSEHIANLLASPQRMTVVVSEGSPARWRLKESA
jgi:hypothetical protein